MIVVACLLFAISGIWLGAAHLRPGTPGREPAAEVELRGTVLTAPLFPYMSQSLDVAGVTNPRLVSGAQSGLVDNDIVIGVVAFGEARAYLQSAFAQRAELHVVNDKLGNIPVTVTYCDLTSCTRVLTSGKSDSLLSIRCGGFRSSTEMAL